MPRIIRRALYQKLRELPELLEFQRDFELLSGMQLASVNELDLGEDLQSPGVCFGGEGDSESSSEDRRHRFRGVTSSAKTQNGISIPSSSS
jgi:hypothetical protein